MTTSGYRYYKEEAIYRSMGDLILRYRNGSWEYRQKLMKKRYNDPDDYCWVPCNPPKNPKQVSEDELFTEFL